MRYILTIEVINISNSGENAKIHIYVINMAVLLPSVICRIINPGKTVYIIEKNAFRIDNNILTTIYNLLFFDTNFNIYLVVITVFFKFCLYSEFINTTFLYLYYLKQIASM